LSFGTIFTTMAVNLPNGTGTVGDPARVGPDPARAIRRANPLAGKVLAATVPRRAGQRSVLTPGERQRRLPGIIERSMQTPEPKDSFLWFQTPWGRALHCGPLGRIASHLFTARDLALDKEGRGRGWSDLSAAMGIPRAALVRLNQVHGAGVVVLRRSDSIPASHDGAQADIVISDRSDVAIAVQVADCVPLLLADERLGAVAAAHAGWRGMVAGVPRVAVEAMAREFGSRLADLVAAIGPSLGPCCGEVGEEVREAFERAGFSADASARWFLDGRRGRPHLDLWQSTRDQLLDAGVAPDRIHACGLCTVTHRDVFYSYRGDGPATGRMVGVIRAGARR
jgi:hypothetical protein